MEPTNVMRKGEGLLSNTSGLISVVGNAGQELLVGIFAVGRHRARLSEARRGTRGRCRPDVGTGQLT